MILAQPVPTAARFAVKVSRVQSATAAPAALRPRLSQALAVDLQLELVEPRIPE